MGSRRLDLRCGSNTAHSPPSPSPPRPSTLPASTSQARATELLQTSAQLQAPLQHRRQHVARPHRPLLKSVVGGRPARLDGREQGSGMVCPPCPTPPRTRPNSLSTLTTLLLALPCHVQSSISSGAGQQSSAVQPRSLSSPHHHNQPRQLQVTSAGTIRGGLAEEANI